MLSTPAEGPNTRMVSAVYRIPSPHDVGSWTLRILGKAGGRLSRNLRLTTQRLAGRVELLHGPLAKPLFW